MSWGSDRVAAITANFSSLHLHAQTNVYVTGTTSDRLHAGIEGGRLPGYRFAARRADCRRGRSSTSLRGPGIRHARGSARLDELPEGVANWRHTGRVETGSARTRPATSHQHRARPDWARHRLEGINRARRGHRHHDRRRQAGLWHLRRPGRVRARVDRGAHDCRPSLGPRARAERRPAVQDDRRQAAAGDGGNGSARDQGRRPVPGTWRHAADPVSACFTQG